MNETGENQLSDDVRHPVLEWDAFVSYLFSSLTAYTF